MKPPATGRAGTFVLDSEGLSRAVRRDRDMIGWLGLAVVRKVPVVTMAMTLVEAVAPGTNRAALRWTLSHVTVEPVTEELSMAATDLLHGVGLHGHRHAIDAVVAATAHAVDGPVSILTSDPEDLKRLCMPRVKIIKV
ncbi:DNA-binding protein [Pseudofrankia sp. BMG5.37]|uniref:DNA-binding protein n=1 Tax=Pseudofrankia sp. BMG5.37 TaxID=3050035 RepID=UPI0037CCA41E